MRHKATTTEFWGRQSRAPWDLRIFLLIPAQWMVNNNWL